MESLQSNLSGSQSQLLVRRAGDEDFSRIRQLLEENFVGNLSAEEREDGFLSINLSEEELREMASNGITVVAIDKDRVAAFLSTQTCDYNRRLALPARMLEVIEHDQATQLDLLKTLVCGPICVSKEYRGKGLVNALYAEMAKEAGDQYLTGITFVSEENPRSLKAHANGLKMIPLFSFEFHEKSYHVLTAPLSQFV